MNPQITAFLAARSSGPDPNRDDLLEISLLLTGVDAPKAATYALNATAAPGSPGSPAAAISAIVGAVPPDAIWIAHDGHSLQAAMNRAGKNMFTFDLIDASELARVCFPTLAGYDLPSLREALGLDPACDDDTPSLCRLTAALWNSLLDRSAKMPAAVLTELGHLYSLTRRHPLKDFFKAAAETAVRAGGETGSLRELYPKEVHPKKRQLALEGVASPIDLDEVAGVFAPHGPMSTKFPAYEARPQQTDMARAVANAFNEGRFLMVEAGTGVGKSLAYLVPSVLWSATNEVPVVISTSTKNLQSQLLNKDIPLLSSILGREFKAVVIKGRRNYLCLRKMLFLLKHASAELSRQERATLAAVVAWSATTGSGDISECSACNGPDANINEEITSAGGECRGPQCDCRGRCFLYKARRRALAADVVIANHSVVLAELDAGDASAVIPPHRHIIMDEAHNLEDAATSAFSVELSARRLNYLVGRLWRPGGRKGGHGLVPLLMNHVEAHSTKCPPDTRARLVKCLSSIVTDQPSLWSSAETLLAAMATLLPAKARRETVRIRAEGKDSSLWQGIDESKRQFLGAIASITAAIDGALEILNGLEEDSMQDQDDYILQLQNIGAELREFMTDADFVLDASTQDHVYWVDRVSQRHDGVRAWAAPIKVGPMLHDMLFAQKTSVVLTSATLSVSGSLSYMKKRLGVAAMDQDRVVELILGSPFEFQRQATALVPSFLPEPDEGQGGYAAELGRLMADVFRATRGRGMGLFTSYSMLTGTAAVLRAELEKEGIPLLVQGESGSRETILEAFKQDGGAVLLGTHSFWEGVDVVGDALSCLVVARLPFAVFTDPIVEARCQNVEAEGESAFMGYSVPAAVIKLRQGFGRLIRSRSDTGIVIVADRRIVSKRYGQWFRNSLPVPVRSIPNRDEFLRAITTFLES